MKKILFGLVVLIMFASCASGKKFGCKGRESWNHMIKRINKPY